MHPDVLGFHSVLAEPPVACRLRKMVTDAMLGLFSHEGISTVPDLGCGTGGRAIDALPGYRSGISLLAVYERT